MLNKNLWLNRFKSGLFGKLGALALAAFIASNASADQFIGHHNGREVVVHTNPIPVFLHRLVPPNYGRHVTAREYQSGRRTTQSISTASPSTTTAPSLNQPRNVTIKP